MLVHVLKSKIHRAQVTGGDINYEGSLTIERDLMDKVSLAPYERILCSNMANGERFVQARSSYDPLPSVIDLHDTETITLKDEQGSEIRTTTVANVKPADVEKAGFAQVWRYDENRLGIVVGSVLVIVAGAAAVYLVTKHK